MGSRAAPNTARRAAGGGSSPGSGAAPRSREAQLQELRVAFRRLFRELSRLRGRDTHLAPGELSNAQFQLLAELDERGELSVGELAQVASMAPGTITEMLDHLAAFGHVERVRSERDRRVVLSRLTPQGRRRIARKRELWQSRWEQALADVGREQLRAATEVLGRLAEMIEQAPLRDGAEGTAAQAKKPRRSG